MGYYASAGWVFDVPISDDENVTSLLNMVKTAFRSGNSVDTLKVAIELCKGFDESQYEFIKHLQHFLEGIVQLNNNSYRRKVIEESWCYSFIIYISEYNYLSNDEDYQVLNTIKDYFQDVGGDFGFARLGDDLDDLIEEGERYDMVYVKRALYVDDEEISAPFG